jgi:hypothetical protein
MLHITGSQTRQQKWSGASVRVASSSACAVQIPKKQVHGSQVDTGIDLQFSRDQHPQRLASASGWPKWA